MMPFTETWIQYGLHDGELFPLDNYIVYRNDRGLSATDKSTDGGVLLAIKTGIPSTRLTNFENKSLEMIWLKLDLGYPLYVCCVYLPDRFTYTTYILNILNVFRIT